MRKIINVFLYWVVKLIQIALITGMVVLQNLTHKSAGVNHHLYYRKAQYNLKYFNDINVMIAKVILILLIIFILIYLFKNMNKISKMKKIEIGLIILWLILIMTTFSLSYFNKLLVYPYLLFAEFISLSLEIIVYIAFHLKKDCK